MTSNSQNFRFFSRAVVVHTYKPSGREVEAGGV